MSVETIHSEDSPIESSSVDPIETLEEGLEEIQKELNRLSEFKKN